MHSILSPCGDELMTPNNILNMAMLKGLDLIAVTDHNTTKQLKVIGDLIESYDFVLIPGVEVTVLERFDVLCYFKTIEDALQFDKFLEKHLDGEWGNYTKENQVVTDIYDLALDTINTPLISTSIPYKTLYKEVKLYNGLVIPAHIDRSSCTILNTYSLDDIPFDGIEISPYRKDSFLELHPELRKYKILNSSDSHTLLTIHEKDSFLELESKTIDSFFAYFEVKQ